MMLWLTERNSEQHVLSDYLTEGEKRPSRFVKGKMLPGKLTFRCPRCEHVQTHVPVHDETGRCDRLGCGLMWVSHGSSLTLWDAGSIDPVNN